MPVFKVSVIVLEKEDCVEKIKNMYLNKWFISRDRLAQMLERSHLKSFFFKEPKFEPRHTPSLFQVAK